MAYFINRNEARAGHWALFPQMDYDTGEWHTALERIDEVIHTAFGGYFIIRCGDERLKSMLVTVFLTREDCLEYLAERGRHVGEPTRRRY